MDLEWTYPIYGSRVVQTPQYRCPVCSRPWLSSALAEECATRKIIGDGLFEIGDRVRLRDVVKNRGHLHFRLSDIYVVIRKTADFHRGNKKSGGPYHLRTYILRPENGWAEVKLVGYRLEKVDQEDQSEERVLSTAVA